MSDTRNVGPRGSAGDSVLTNNTTYPRIEDQVTVDGTTILGNGTTRDPLRAVGGSASGNRQSFVYTATGAESDSFTVTLPAARASASYVVQVTQGAVAATLKQASADPATFSTTQFTLALSSAPDAGDSFLITVEDLT